MKKRAPTTPTEALAPLALRKKTVIEKEAAVLEEGEECYAPEDVEATQRIEEDLELLIESSNPLLTMNPIDSGDFYLLSLPFLTENLDPCTRVVATGSIQDTYTGHNWFCLVTNQKRKDKTLAFKCFKIMTETERENLKTRFRFPGVSR